MAILPGSLDYTDKDFDALRARLVSLVQSVFPDWTDYNVANFGNILLEMMAFTGDVLTFYQDNQANESRWTTARQRRNIIALAKLIGFKAEGARASQVDVEVRAVDLSTNGPPIANVMIPAGTFIFTADVTDPIQYQLLSDAVILAGSSTPVEVTAENSAPASQSFASNGLQNQGFRLTERPYLDDSLEVTAADGTYTEVDNFLSSTSTDRHFTVSVDQNDRALVRFGNGVNGKIPVGVIQMNHKTGGGSSGKVEPNSLTQIPGTFSDGLGNAVLVTVNNPEASSGEQDRQTVGQIRVAAPESIRVIERAVSREDFDISAKQVAGVARALMTTSNEDVAVPENTGFLYIVPEGGGNPTQTLKDEVAARFAEDGETPATLTFEVIVRDPIYLDVDVYAVVYLTEKAVRDPSSDSFVGDDILGDLTEYFALNIANEDGETVPNEKIGFGYFFKDGEGNPSGEIPLSDIYNIVRDNVFVRKIGTRQSDFTLNGEHSDVTILTRNFPRLGKVTIIDGDSGSTLIST